MVKETQRRSGLKWYSFFSDDLLHGLLLILLDWTRLRGRRLEKKVREESVKTSIFLQNLATL
jgi:hypothetical protein